MKKRDTEVYIHKYQRLDSQHLCEVDQCDSARDHSATKVTYTGVQQKYRSTFANVHLITVYGVRTICYLSDPNGMAMCIR